MQKESQFGPCSRYISSVIAAEISRLSRYYDQLIQLLLCSNDTGLLLNQIISKNKRMIHEIKSFPDLTHECESRSLILINGALNYHSDIQGLLTKLRRSLSRSSRLVLVIYNPYLRWLYKLASIFRIRKGEFPTTFLTRVDLSNLAMLSGFEIIRARPVVYFPWKFLGFGNLLNSIFAAIPFFRWFSLAYLCFLRPVVSKEQSKPSLTIVIPARNERGNIENALKRMPDFRCLLEIIFIEGHSSDGTWKEIQQTIEKYKNQFQIAAYQQTGKGKNDAVRLGFSKAKNDVLTILDADLTMPPEKLLYFYQAYCDGRADFINGSRLVYPMEGEAMRFLNWLGNVFFAKALSWVLDASLGDTLCGTKMVSRSDYKRILDWRKDFGDFDPFGDFELIFPAATIGFGIVDIPICYGARTYGSTNIHRFRHGLMLFRMVLIGLFRIRFGAWGGSLIKK